MSSARACKIVCKSVLFAGLLMLSATACKKTEKDPVVKNISAVIQPDGSITVTGELQSDGAAPVTAVGFCMDTLPRPGTMSNQVVLAKPEHNRFSYTFPYDAIKTKATHYFRSWAMNANGYTVTDDDLVTSDAGLDAAAIPCHPSLNEVFYDGYTSGYGDIFSSPANGWSIYTYFRGTSTITYTFAEKPVASCIYQTTDNVSAYNDVVVSINSHKAAAGQKLYLYKVGDAAFEVTACDLTAPATAGPVTTRFKVYTF